MAHILANNLTPYIPVHPGSVLKDEFEFRNVTPEDVSKTINIPVPTIENLLDCRQPLTVELALLIESAYDIPAEPLLTMQNQYDIQVMKSNSDFASKLKQLRKIAAVL